jgi:predicted 2-oxoglutarate/Fe(II)-dependent dioxygenase YbiX
MNGRHFTSTGVRFEPGDRMPPFKARTRSNPQFSFDTMGGCWLVLGLIASSTDDDCRCAVATMMAADDVFDDRHARLFIATRDPNDETQGTLVDRLPGRRIFRDHDGAVARLAGISTGASGVRRLPRSVWLFIDPAFTIRHVVPMREDGRCAEKLLEALAAAPPADRFAGFAVPPPILVLPDIFEPDFCERLIGMHRQSGGASSGFMRERDGKTVLIKDASFKVRRDLIIDDPAVISQVQSRIIRKVVPQIERVHFFRCTRMERYLVGCYPAEEGGHFQPHRDNTTPATMHRRFAVSINLNEDFEGGEVSFPEYAPRGFKAPRGAAIVFSCSLLHAVSRVTAGARYAFLPFLYDDAAAEIRRRNSASLETHDAAAL